MVAKLKKCQFLTASDSGLKEFNSEEDVNFSTTFFQDDVLCIKLAQVGSLSDFRIIVRLDLEFTVSRKLRDTRGSLSTSCFSVILSAESCTKLQESADKITGKHDADRDLVHAYL